MNIQIIAVGSLSPEFKKVFEKYEKSISHFSNLNVVEIKEFSEEKNINVKVQKETNLILSKFQKDATVFLCSLQGKQYDSVEFAQLINQQNNRNLTFVIGGSNGVDEQKFDSNFKISISKMTFPHQLFRCILAEQIYRAFSILENKKYHK
ncbi:23S rRNA (pseudouridine(1915)-N(3))-methyltransferase RlmH [Mycoplasmopsis hyopharyngis]|uniref:23S rRNA (pseudouridine(1915)-N(3))-methyltransferase RlmH n=1 Tax=Mycoplasmopsis hyopharyngis TaxID=29558 RepID=UPI003873A29E